MASPHRRKIVFVGTGFLDGAPSSGFQRCLCPVIGFALLVRVSFSPSPTPGQILPDFSLFFFYLFLLRHTAM